MLPFRERQRRSQRTCRGRGGVPRPHLTLLPFWQSKWHLISEPGYGVSLCYQAGHCSEMTNPHKSIYSFITIHPDDIIEDIKYKCSSTFVPRSMFSSAFHKPNLHLCPSLYATFLFSAELSWEGCDMRPCKLNSATGWGSQYFMLQTCPESSRRSFAATSLLPPSDFIKIWAFLFFPPLKNKLHI